MVILNAHSADAVRISRGSKTGIGYIKPTRHFNALRAQCPAPYCLFEGSRPDIVLKHSWHDHSLDESGKCTCGARACKRARDGSRKLWSYHLCTLSASVGLQRIRLLMNTLIQNLASIRSEWEGYIFGVSVFYASWRRGSRDVAMVDKIEVTVHVSIKLPLKFGLAQMTLYCRRFHSSQ